MKRVSKAVLAAAALGVVLVSTPVQASSWLECEGSATVTAAAQDGSGVWQLSAEAAEARVTDGFGTAGADCTEAKGVVTFTSNKEIAAGQTVRFKYRFYGGLGPQGPVTSRTWTLLD